MLESKRVIISAAASGMGRAGCVLFAKAGATVAAIDVDEAKLAEVVAEVTAAGGKAFAVVGDLSTEAGCRAAMQKAISKLGGVDILWNHVGVPGPEGLESVSLDAYDRTFDLNLRASVVCTQEAVPLMRSSGSGAIVFTSSMGGLVGAQVSPLYAAAKHAVIGLVKSLGIRYAPENIRVNAVCPGPIATPMLPQFFQSTSAEQSAENEKKVVAGIPMGRLGRPEEVAQAALWLASPLASYVTGTWISVDGGYTAK